MNKSLASAALIALVALAGPFAAASPQDTVAARCLISSTTPQDKTLLVQWIFSVVALAPEVTPLSKVTQTQRNGLNRNVATLIQRLVTQDCRQQFKSAIVADSPNSGQVFALAFKALGAAAVMHLFKEKAVVRGTFAYTRYLDLNALKSVFPGAAAHK